MDHRPVRGSLRTVPGSSSLEQEHPLNPGTIWTFFIFANKIGFYIDDYFLVVLVLKIAISQNLECSSLQMLSNAE